MISSKFTEYTQEELAKKLGRDRSTIANMLRLLQLPSAFKNDLETGRFSSGHARSILSLPNEGVQLEIGNAYYAIPGRYVKQNVKSV
ncbi:MAG: hypothetical protein Ct9H300mP28_37030 [Pseudomonadota bacterium]|nr:MAG: hypothetical protein Ct9H300mP28_37030 [Pseudomonadota bacterium]